MFRPFSLNLHGYLTEFTQPAVMGILNVTPDSFYAGSRAGNSRAIASRVETMLEQGVDIIDIGGCSTRPGAPVVDTEEELSRVREGLKILRGISSNIPVSVDTFRSRVALEAVNDFGADIINDITGGDADGAMIETVGQLKVPYIIMHTRGTPETMNSMTDYDNVAAEVSRQLQAKVRRLALQGISDVIVDPGIGFAKTVEQNYYLLNCLEVIEEITDRPLLIGLSRKSLITKPLEIPAEEALAPTTALNLYALQKGASILRVHDIKEAVMAVKLNNMLNGTFETATS